MNKLMIVMKWPKLVRLIIDIAELYFEQITKRTTKNGLVTSFSGRLLY